MEVRTSNQFLSSPSTDLAIRETILSRLSKIDNSGKGLVEAAELDKVFVDFDCPRDSDVAKKILKHCKYDTTKTHLDFNTLKNALTREREVLDAKVALKAKNGSAHSNNNSINNNRVVYDDDADDVGRSRDKSTTIISSPTPTSSTQEMLNAKRGKVVEDQRKQVTTIHNMLAKHEIDADTASYLLGLYNIQPTKQFLKLADSMMLNEVKLSDFTRALTTGDPMPGDALDPLPLLAGNTKRISQDPFEEPMPVSPHCKPSNVMTIGSEEVKLLSGKRIPVDRHLNDYQVKLSIQHSPLGPGSQAGSNASSSSLSSSVAQHRGRVSYPSAVSSRRNLHGLRTRYDHMDPVSWRHELTEEVSKMDEHVKAKKGEGYKKHVANDVINWESHHEKGCKAPESAFWDQFKGEGGFQISKGLKNKPSQPDLMAFKPSSPNSSSSSSSIIMGDATTTFVPLPYQNEVPLAGTPSKKGETMMFFSDSKTRRPSTQGIHHQVLRPYGLEGGSLTEQTGRSRSAGKRVGYANSATIHRNPISSNSSSSSSGTGLHSLSDDRPSPARIFVSSNPILNTERTIYVSPNYTTTTTTSSSSGLSSSSSPQQQTSRNYNRPLSEVLNFYST